MKFKEFSITFHTDKIKECTDFYNQYFQATIVFDAGWYVMVRLQSDENTQPIFLNFQSNTDKIVSEQFVGGVTLNLKTEDVDACYEQIKKADLIFVEDITNHEWGDRAFSIKDPIGNLLYVYSEREIADEYKDAVKA